MSGSATQDFLMSLHRLAGEMAQLVKGLAAKPAVLSSVPGIHTVEGDPLPPAVLWPLTGACACTHIHITGKT